MNNNPNNGYNNNFRKRNNINNKDMNFHKTPPDFNRHSSTEEEQLEQIRAQQEQNRINQVSENANLSSNQPEVKTEEETPRTDLGNQSFQLSGAEKIKKLAKKAILATITPSGFIIILVAIVSFLVLMTPITRLANAAGNITGFFSKLKNTFTTGCLMCTDEEVAATEQAKREEAFFKKVNKIEKAMENGKGMKGGPDNRGDKFSVKLDLPLLVSSILYNDDLFQDEVEAMTNTIGENNKEENINIDSDEAAAKLQELKRIENQNDKEKEKEWLSNNKEFLNQGGLGDQPTITEAKTMLEMAQKDFFGVGWYEAKGDIKRVTKWHGINDPYIKADPSVPCYPTEYEYSTEEDPAWASNARKIAKHMVERQLDARCWAEPDYDDDGNIIGYHWESEQLYDYVLNVEESDLHLYNEEVHKNPYPKTRRIEEIEELPHPNPYVKYMLNQYIPIKHVATVHNEEVVGLSEYITSLKVILRKMYTYRDTYEQWLKYWSEETSGEIVGGACDYNFITDDNKASISTSNLKVRLLDCDTNQPIEGEELIDFEKYILGVVYQENGGAPTEAIKAQAIAARNFALKGAAGRSEGSNQYFSENQSILNIANGTCRQVYCDPDQGCSTEDGYQRKVYSGQKDGMQSKGPVSGSVRAAVNEVKGEVLTNSKGEIIGTNYIDDVQKAWNKLASEGKDYNEILTYWYSQGKYDYDASKIVKVNCTSGGFVAGNWSSWKQSIGSPWANVQLVDGVPGTTIHEIGCTATSIAILIAGSGTKVNIEDFNPGTFVEALKKVGGFDDGGNLYWNKVSQIAPNFHYTNDINLSGEWSKKINRISEELNKGNYLVLNVNNGGHWVAVDRIEGQTIYTYDPAAGKRGIIGPETSDYSLSSVVRVVAYKKVD